MKLIISLLFIVTSCFAQTSPKQVLLDSLNTARENDRGVFKLYVKKPEVEMICGFYRNRVTKNQALEPINFTYHVYLPFQYDLSYLNLKAKDKLMKINMPLIVHHSNHGNYAIGLGTRFSFLTFKKTYLSYQAGVVWCEAVKPKANDGINYMGFCLHHEFSLSCHVSKHIKLSANAIHISNGKIFKEVKNLQDVLGLGVSYLF